jgi:predicted MFS family arabinose efflux permease
MTKFVSDTKKQSSISRRGWTVLVGLTVAQLLSAAGQMTVVTLAGITGALLAPAPQFATLPVAAGVVGLAFAALPIALLIRHFGRRRVFTAMALWAATGAVVAATAVNNGSFAGFALGCFMLGNNMAAMAQYRFAVADSVPTGMISRAVSTIMLGTLTAALVAPWIALRSRHLLATEFAGSFIVLVIPFLIVATIISLLPLPAAHTTPGEQKIAGSLRGVLARRDIQLAIVAAAVGYGVMSLIMTATPISMHVMDGFSVATTANVIRAHMLAMFLPSLFSGWLIARLGITRALWLGLLLEGGAVIITIVGQAEGNYLATLILLGAGWNFLFVGGTTLLASACQDTFKYRVQGINEIVLFGTMAIGALVAGPLLTNLGWVSTNICAGLLLALIVIAILRARPDR